MNAVSCTVRTRLGLVAHATNEIVTLNNHIDIVGDKQLHSTQERIDINLLVLGDYSVAEV